MNFIFTDTETDIATLRSCNLRSKNFDDSQIPAIHIKYRISLRSSSLQEPRYPLLKVVFLKI